MTAPEVIDLRELLPQLRIEDIDAERAVLGALIRGTLCAEDARDADVDASSFWYGIHADIYDALLLVATHPEAWRERDRQRSGLPLGAVRLVCKLWDVWPVGRYLGELGQHAPRRGVALKALEVLQALREERWEASLRRDQMIRDLRAWVKDAAGFLVRREHDQAVVDLTYGKLIA